MKKIAPPGRRASVKREAFKTDESVAVEEIPVSNLPSQDSGPAAATNNLEHEQRVAAEAAAAEAEQQGRQREAMQHRQRQQDEDARRQQVEEAARQQAESARLQAEAEQREAEEAAERQARLEARRRQRQQEEEDARQAAAAQERERVRQQQIAEEESAAVAAAEEEERRQEAIRRRREEKERARRQAELEEEERRAAEEEAERRRLELERAEMAERQRLEAEQAELAERQRLEAEQAELVRKQERELEEMRRQARENAAARKRAEEAEAAEIARQAEAERQKALREAQAAAIASQQKEDAELEAKRRRAEEQRRKRQMFLSDMDSFSNQFESQTQVKEERLNQANKKHEELLTTIATKELKVQSDRPLTSEPVVFESKPVVIDTTPIIPASPASNEEPSRRIVEGTSSGKRREEIDLLSNSLFSSTSQHDDNQPATITSKHNEFDDAPTFAKSDLLDELRVPTRIGGSAKDKGSSKSDKSTVAKSSSSSNLASSQPVVEDFPPSPPAKPEEKFYPQEEPQLKPVAPTIVPPTRGIVIVEEDEEEEGTGALESISNILTREERRTMTTDQKASWKAKQADLHTRRKDFHGAVTYMFDGVFSWQMYGSAEALDEYGNTYTEYLMRCQWGTSFENMQPWIVAHRYREFDFLDQQFKKQFPHMEKNMPKLPKKEMFRSMDTSVIAKRRGIIEDYMSKIVETMPTLLRSDTMNNFLRIKERISAIKNLLRLQESVALEVTEQVVEVEEGSESAGGHSEDAQTQQPTRRKSVKQENVDEDVVLVSVPCNIYLLVLITLIVAVVS